MNSKISIQVENMHDHYMVTLDSVDNYKKIQSMALKIFSTVWFIAKYKPNNTDYRDYTKSYNLHSR